MQNYLCLSIDGLQSGMIGAYGNTWIQTPALDAFASQSVLFDRFYASSLDMSNTLAEWWRLPADLHRDYHKVLITDDADVFLHEHASHFDEKHRLESKQYNRPAKKIEGTQLYHNFATLADILHHHLDNRLDKPVLFWAHFKGLRGRWDFPLSYRRRYQIEQDPYPYAEVVPPDIDLTDIVDPDVRQAVAEAYSGGVTVLDDVFFGLFEFFMEEGLDEDTVLLFTSVRGFSLGEHRYIGANDELYGENVHLPLIIRFPHGTTQDTVFAGFRSQTLLQPADIWELLQAKVFPEEPDARHRSISIRSDGLGNKVDITPDWFVYRKPSGCEMYVKPDDRWEVNDVADRCSHILEEFELQGWR